jgi:hypothetical protein
MNPYVNGEAAWQRIQERLRQAENQRSSQPTGVAGPSPTALPSNDCDDCDDHEEVA